MKPQKQKDYSSKRITGNGDGYYLDDIECRNCVNWRGKKRGCPLSECDYDTDKQLAIKNGRIKRSRGAS